MLFQFESFSKIAFEQIARTINKSPFLTVVLDDIYNGILTFVRAPLGRGHASVRWCEIRKNSGRCRLPNYRYCSNSCIGGYNLEERCPPGYRPSHAWGYAITGCWCDVVGGRNVVCCDCTPMTNSPYHRSRADCGCMHYLSQRLVTDQGLKTIIRSSILF